MATLNQIKERPSLKLPYTRSELILEIAAVLGFLVMVAMIVTALPDLPAKIPAHFGQTGQPDRWMAKESIFTLPITEVVIYLLLTLFFFFPNFLNYPWEITKKNAEIQYRYMRLLIGWEKMVMSWMFTFIMWSTIQVARGRASAINNSVMYIYLFGIVAGLIAYIIIAARAREGKPGQKKNNRWAR